MVDRGVHALRGAPVDEQVPRHPVGELHGHHPHQREREVDVRERRSGRQHVAVADEHPVGVELDDRVAPAEQRREPPRRRRAPPAQQAGLGEGEGAGARPREHRAAAAEAGERRRQPDRARCAERREHAGLVERPERGDDHHVGVPELVRPRGRRDAQPRAGPDHRLLAGDHDLELRDLRVVLRAQQLRHAQRVVKQRESRREDAVYDDDREQHVAIRIKCVAHPVAGAARPD